MDCPEAGMYQEDDLLPLSGLQHMSFCERRWALIHIEGQWEENLYTTEGRLMHERAHSGEVESRPGVLIRRTLSLRSFRLGLSGQSDIVEFLPCTGGEPGIVMPRRDGLWRPYPIEYKRSRDKHGGTAYRIQLCAQALCLEEMMGVPVLEGAVFDSQAKRRDRIAFDAELRSEVERLALRMHELFTAQWTPQPVYERKCEKCSLNGVCLPRGIQSMSASQYVSRSVATSLGTGRRTA
jgi:CRISPR-associated exonuclease Cas4